MRISYIFFVIIIFDLNFILYLPNLIQLQCAFDSDSAAVEIIFLCCLTSVV